MRNKNTRKGFTTVELVIVIAVIAILATVLIPTFSNMIEKANLSADTQNVRNMNMVLSTYILDGEPEHFGIVRERLLEGGYKTGEEFLPKTAGHKYFWYVDKADRNGDGIKENISVILLVNERDPENPKVVYPKEYENLDKTVITDVYLCFDLNLPAMVINKKEEPGIIIAEDDAPGQQLNLSVKYVFEDNNGPSAKYSDWITTFYASCDLPDGYENMEIDIPLTGYYEQWGKWELCLISDMSENSEPVDVLQLVGVGEAGMTYAEVQRDIGTFECGVIDATKTPEALLNQAFRDDYDPVPAGTILTVELRLTNPENPADIAVAGIFRYTFQ